MASVKREDSSRGPRWRVRYRRPDGTETSRRFDRRRLADDFAVRVEHDRRAGFYIDPTGPRTTFADMARRWQQNVTHAPATAAVRDGDLRNWVVPALGRYRLDQIGELELRGFLKQLQGSLAPATVERVWAWVTAIFASAVRARLLTLNPTAGLAPPGAPRPLLVPLEHEQVEAVIAALPAWYGTAAWLAADAGLRISEAAGLTTSRTTLRHLSSGRLSVERQLVSLPRTPLHLTLPKGRKVRSVPIPASMAARLSEHLARYPARPVVVDRVTGEPAELVFATRYGTPARRQTVEDAWAKAVRAAGLPAGTRFHDLRHYYAAVLVDAGLPDREIGERLGHSSAAVTARYGHLFTYSDERTRAAVEAAEARRAR